MEFKAGDRVHVTRLNTNEVDFYATLKDYNDGHPFILSNCSDGRFECCSVFKPNTGEVGLNRWDYYVLAEDEEDTEEPVIQRTTDPVNHPDHYNYGEIEIIDFIEQVTQHYNSDVAYHIGNAIKYLARSPHKNGKEDIEKARWYIERAYQKWSD
ncbi:DUF3310 domain-containing protein [Mammaliicoccus sp. A-M4]|uniref:DUF3310 domain-containing protein n=1 Tax=Mammaliicoccus sp. A-M4 TaxID=2898664 RepID=UPI001EFBFC39|nr:DUF3310 domain-containing protein [Mammaliicoccus sp. A-M4]